MKPQTNKKKFNYFYGLYCEIATIVFLTLKGYQIIYWRYKTKLGEIDIIAKKANKIHFIEVKGRAKNFAIDELVTPKQIKRIKACSNIFISRFSSKYFNFDFSYDLVAYVLPLKIKHYRNILN